MPIVGKFFCSLGFVFLIHPLAAEDSRTCRVLFPDRPGNAPSRAYLFDGEKSYRINMPSMNFSEVIAMPAGELNFALVPTDLSDAEVTSLKAPRLLIPKEVKDFYILMSPDSEFPDMPVKMEYIDLSASEVAKGQTLWLNRTSHRIHADLGDSVLTLEPMSRSVSKAPIDRNGQFAANFSYQVNAEGDLKRISEQGWPHDTNNRHFGIVMYSGGNLPQIFYFRDFRVEP